MDWNRLDHTTFSYVLSWRGENRGGRGGGGREVGRVFISKQSLWSRQRCCYYHYHPSPSFDFNQVLNTSIVAPPERGSSRLPFFLFTVSNYGTVNRPARMLWALRDSVPRRLVEFWRGGRDFGHPSPHDRCATGIVKGLWIRGRAGGSVLPVIGVWGRKDSDEFERFIFFFWDISFLLYTLHREEIYQNYRRTKLYFGSCNI